MTLFLIKGEMRPLYMKRANSAAARFGASLCFLLLIGVSTGRAADLSQAKVRQKFNVVTLAPNLNASARPVAQGAVVENENVVRTGTESRAELEFTDLTLARIGANSIFTFDAQARSLACERGAVLFSKPTNSGRVEIRSGAVTAAITGSTGFVSTTHKRAGKKQAAVSADDATTMLGMLEGKLHGSSNWKDSRGNAHSFQFSLGAGEMLIAEAGRPPSVVQFDIPKFLRSSPLITGFKGDLLNQSDLRRAVADYETDQRRGFIDANTVTVNRANLAWVGLNSNHNSLDASVDSRSSGQSVSTGDGGGFVPVGGDGVIRGQLVWTSTADLDLHLILPDNQEVFFANSNVTFNNGRATAMLDHDNRGGTIDQEPNIRVENIAINGTLSAGTYTFFGHNFFTSNTADNFTLTVSNGNGQTQTISGSIANNQNTQNVTVTFPPHG